MNQHPKAKKPDEYLGDPEIGIERAEDEETPKETHGGNLDENRPE